MKVFIVTDGEYSGNYIKGVFSTLEKAKQAVEVWATTNGVDEYDLDDMPAMPANGLFPWQVSMKYNGDSSTDFFTKTGRLEYKGVAGLKTDYITSNNNRQGWSATFYMFAKDENHAVKIANERRTQLIANGEWVPGKVVGETK